MERNYDFRQRLVQVHKPGQRLSGARPGSDELVLSDETEIVVPANAGRVIERAARDMQDYLAVSMGLDSRIRRETDLRRAAASGQGKIVFGTRADTGAELMEGDAPRGYRIDCDSNVLVTGRDEAGAMQGGFALEEAMSMRRAPFLKKGTVARRPLFSPRMVHSGYGLDNYPDAHIAAIAHSGMDAILVFVKGPDATPFGYMDFNELCRRAAEWGVDVYVYSYLKSTLHPDDPGGEAYYDRVYGSVFASCPGFKGIVMVGESVEFPSKDERTTGTSYLTPTEDGLPAGKPSPGWWPCRDYPRWLDVVKRAVRKQRPDADVVFWTYNWGYVAEKERIELIDSLPTDISLLVTFEMFETFATGSVTGTCVDYTLGFEGPGGYFTSEAKAAHRRGIRLYSMTNTGGLTWDIGVIPYEPAPGQWMRRHAAILEMRERYGLSGLMESHHYGFWPSFVSELAKWTFTSGTPRPAEVLRMLAARDFGEANAERVLEAWELWSDGIRHYPSTNEDQYGPFRIGPSYPLVLFRHVKPPQSPFAVFGNRIINTLYGPADSGRCSPLSFRLPVEIEYLTVMRDRFEEGARILDSLVPGLEGTQRDEADRMANLGMYMSRCARTTIHVKEWYRRKLALAAASTAAELESAVGELEAIGREEIANAEATIPLVLKDSRLGWEPTMEYMCDESHLRWKIKQVRLVLEHELPIYRDALRHSRS
jgi:hypothetical protein